MIAAYVVGWLIFSSLVLVLASYFLFLYSQDKDNNKLILFSSFFLTALSALLYYSLGGSDLILVSNFFEFSSLLVLFALFSIIHQQLFNNKKKNFFLYFYLASFIAFFFIILLPTELLYQFNIIRQIVGFELIIASLYLFVKDRNFTTLFFLLSILSFDLGGYLGIFNQYYFLFGMFMGYFCLGLIFILESMKPTKNVDKGMGSYFSVRKELNQVSEKLEESKRLYTSLYETIDEGIAIYQPVYNARGKPVDYKYVDVNPSYEKTFQLPKDQVLGKTVKQLHQNNTLLPSVELFDRAFLTGQSQINEFDLDDNSKAFRQTLFRPKKDFLILTLTDVSKEKESQNKLEENIENLQKNEMATLNIMEDFQTTMVDLKQSQKMIQQQNEKLKELDRLKTNFLNTTSHELRTPMTAMKGYVQMMINKQFGEITDEQKEALDVVFRNTDRLDSLINDILDISRLESKSMKFIAKPASISELIEDIIKTMNPQAQSKQITLTSNVEENLPEITIDSDRIRQVIINLINNAIKFSPENSTITVLGQHTGENITIKVKDQGRGVPKEKLVDVFDSFFQVDMGVDRSYGGAGLGLSICKGIVLAHGGKIWVESEVDKGSTFQFTLPLEPVEDLGKEFEKTELFSSDKKKDNEEDNTSSETETNAEQTKTQDEKQEIKKEEKEK